MMQLQGFRNRRLSTVFAQCLVALFFFQTLLPMQAHSRISTDDQGIAVMVCTLQGEKTVFVDLDGQQHAKPQPSAAMLFSDLINDLTPTHGVLQPPARLLGLAQPVHQAISHVAGLSPVSPLSRAPPRA